MAKNKPTSEPLTESAHRIWLAGLGALATAEKLGRRAAQVGFDWREVSDVLEKVREETRELELDLREKGPDARRDVHVEEELGDLLFSVSNLARHLGMSPEVALRRANEKFERRFRAIEPNIVADGSMQIEQMDELWEEVKRGEEAARSESEEVKRSE